MEQAGSSPKLEEYTEQSQRTESLSPAVDPLLLETGPGGKNVAGHEQSVTQLCHTLLRRCHELQPETKHRLRSQLRVQSSPSTDNVVTIELSDEEDEVLQQSNTKAGFVDDVAETALGDTLRKDDGELQSVYDLVIKEKDDVTLALSAKELKMNVRDVIQENLSEDMTSGNVLKREAEVLNPSRNGDDEISTCVVKEKNIALEDELHGGNILNLVQQTISKNVMPIVAIPKQQPGNKDFNEGVVNENSKSTVHPDREINGHSLHLCQGKLEAEVRRDKSKLLHENLSKIRVFNDYVPELKKIKSNPRKRNLKSFNADHDHLFSKKKRSSSKRQHIRMEKELVVRYENISTLRDHMETRVERTRNDSIQLNHSKYIPGVLNIFDPAFQTLKKDYYVRKSINVNSYKGFGDNSKKVSKNNNFNMTLNVYEDLNEGYRLFSSPKKNVVGDYLIHEDDPGLVNNDNKGNARSEVDLIGVENSLSPESNILVKLQEVDVSNVEAIIDFDSYEENATIKGIAGNVNKNSSNRVIRTYSAFRRNTTQGDNETTHTHDNRENLSIVNINNVTKTYEGYNRIRKIKSCESKHEISKQDSAVANKNASSKSTENDDATILESGGDNAKGCNKNPHSHNKKPRKGQQNESSKDTVNLFRDHNYVDMNRRSCSSAGAGTDNEEAEVAVDATDPKLLMRPVVAIKKLTDQIWDEMALRRPSRSPTPICDLTPPLSPLARHKASPLVTPRSSRSTNPDFSAPAPKSVKERRARKMLLNERNERSRLTKKVELSDIEEVRRHNRNMLTAQVTPITQHQGDLINTASCDHNKSPNTSRSPGCAVPRPAPAPPAHSAAGRLRRDAACRARSFITIISKKRKYISSKVKRKPVIVGVKPYRRKRRRRRPRSSSPPDNVSNDDENMPNGDLIILENEEEIRRNNPVPRSETITSESNDTPSTLNEGLPTRNLATHHKEQDAILSSTSVADFKSVPSNDALSIPIEGVPTLSLSTAQKEQNTARSLNPLAHLNSAQLMSQSESSNALIECVSTLNLSKLRKEREPPRSLKQVTFNIPIHVTAIQKERKKSSVNPLKIGVEPRRKQKQRLHLRSESPDDVSSVLDESEPMRDLIVLENNPDPCSLRPASSSAVPVLDEGVSMRELTTTQSNPETNAYHRNSVPSNTAPSILEGLLTQGLTIVCYPNTRRYGFIAPSSSTARETSVLSKNVQTRDVITILNKQKTASKRATRIEPVPSSLPRIQNKLDICKRVTLPLPNASLEKVKVCEERKQQKLSSKSGFMPLLFRGGSVSKKALLKEDFASLHEKGTTNFSNAKGIEIKRSGIVKYTSSCDSMLANNGTFLSSTLPISTQTNLENQNSLEQVSEIASNSVPNVAEINQLLSSPEAMDTPQAKYDPVIVNVQSLAPSQELTKERNFCTPAAETTVQVSDGTNKSLPVITLTQAKPVCVSYLTNPLREIHDFTSDPKGPKEVTQQLPKIINVTSYTNEQVSIPSTNDRNCHNLAATLIRTVPSSEQVTSPTKWTHLPNVIGESDVQGRSVASLGPELIQPGALPKITLKRAQPVFASYYSPNEMEVLISDPQEEGQEMHLPRVGDVTGDLHVIQQDDRMGLHLVVSQDEVYNDSLSISQPNF